MTQIQSNPVFGLKMISQKRILLICNTSDQLLFQSKVHKQWCHWCSLVYFSCMYIIWQYSRSFGSHFINKTLILIRIIQYISNLNYLWVVENTVDFQFHLCVLETCHSAYFNNTVNQTKMCGMLLSTAFKNAFVNEIMWCNIIIIRD